MKTWTPTRAAAALLLFAGLAPLPVQADDAAPQKIELKLAVKAGDAFYFRQTSHIDQAMKVGEMDLTTTIATAQTSTYAVQSVGEDGQTSIKVTIGDIKGSFENAMLGGVIEFDTASGEDAGADNPMIGPAIKGITMLANKSYEMTLDRHGAVVAVKGMKEIMEAAFKGNPAFAGKSMGAMFDDEGMKRQMQGQFATFTDGPVAIGAKWNLDSSIKVPEPMKIVTQYTLTSADAVKAVVTSKSTVTTSKDAADRPGTQSDSTITVSRADGLMLKTESKTLTSLDMPMPGGGEDAPKMHMDMTATVTVERVTAADVKPAPKTGAPKPATPETAPPK